MRQTALLYTLAFATFVLLAPGCCTAALRVEAPPRSERDQSAAAVEVRTFCPTADGKVRISFGSGVQISDHTVLTAAHVVPCPLERSAVIVVIARSGETLARPMLVGIDDDIVRLDLVTTLPARKAQIGPRPAPQEIVCMSAAVPKRGRKCGLVDGFGAPPGDVTHGANTVPGNSGAGVYDVVGRLVGIVTHYRRCGKKTCGGKFTSLEGRAWATR